MEIIIMAIIIIAFGLAFLLPPPDDMGPFAF
jgi:hypothetical protein